MQSFAETPAMPLIRRWPLVVGLGVIMTVVGVLLLANPFSAVRVLAIYIAIGLILTGIEEWAQSERHSVGWPSKLLGLIWIVTGVVALFWPGVTVWALAVVVAIGLIVGGVVQLIFTLQFRRELPAWGIWGLNGVISIVFGVLALSWPKATVLVMAILLGLWVLIRGIATIVFGLGLRSLNATSKQIQT